MVTSVGQMRNRSVAPPPCHCRGKRWKLAEPTLKSHKTPHPSDLIKRGQVPLRPSWWYLTERWAMSALVWGLIDVGWRGNAALQISLRAVIDAGWWWVCKLNRLILKPPYSIFTSGWYNPALTGGLNGWHGGLLHLESPLQCKPLECKLAACFIFGNAKLLLKGFHVEKIIMISIYYAVVFMQKRKPCPDFTQIELLCLA